MTDNRPTAATLAQHKADGMTYQEIARKYRVGLPAVKKWIDDAGLRSERKRQPAPPKAELQALYDTPMTQREIVTHYDASPATVKRWFQNYGISGRIGRWSHKTDPDEPSIVAVEELQALYETGMTDAQIGERFGISGKAVNQRRTGADYPSRKRGTYSRGGETQPAPAAPPRTVDRPMLRLSEADREKVRRRAQEYMRYRDQNIGRYL